MALSQQFRSVRVLPIFILPFSYNFIIIIMIIINDNNKNNNNNNNNNNVFP